VRIARPLAIVVSLGLLVGPGTALASDHVDAPPVATGDSGWAAGTKGEFYAFRQEGGVSFTDAGLLILTIAPDDLGPPLDAFGATADSYEVITTNDAGRYGTVRLRSISDLSFATEGVTPVILGSVFDGTGGYFLDGQRVIDLPPMCQGGRAGPDGCLDPNLRLGRHRSPHRGPARSSSGHDGPGPALGSAGPRSDRHNGAPWRPYRIRWRHQRYDHRGGG
jgi:hypothetical protein